MLSDILMKLADEVHDLREKLQEHTHQTLRPEPSWQSIPNLNPRRNRRGFSIKDAPHVVRRLIPNEFDSCESGTNENYRKARYPSG